MQPVCSKNTPSASQYCSPLLTTIIYEANMQHRDLYGSLYTIENSDVQPWSGFEKWLKIKHIRTLKLSESQGIYDCR